MLLSTTKVIALLDENVKLNLKMASLRQRIPEGLLQKLKAHCKNVMDRPKALLFYLEVAEVIYDEFNMEPNDPPVTRNLKDKQTYVVDEKKKANDNYNLAKDMEAEHKRHTNLKHCTNNGDGIFFPLLDFIGTISNSLIMESASGKRTDLYLVMCKLSQLLQTDCSMGTNHRKEKLDLVNSIISLVKGQLTLRNQRIEFSEGRYPPQCKDTNNHNELATTGKGYIHDFKLNTSTQKWTIEMFPSFADDHGLTPEKNYCIPFLTLVTWGNVGLSSSPL